jgi:predicted permease
MIFAHDLLAAVRSLRKNIGFTCAVVAMLAVGIGATTAMFSVADGVLFAPLPYANEKRLVAIVNHGTRAGENMSPLDFLDLRRSATALDELGAVYAHPVVLTGEGDPMQIGAGNVTANWFTMLGMRAEIGRVFAAGEDAVGAARVVIISDELWRTRFGADRGVLGKTIMIGGEPHTVIGVSLPTAALPYRLSVWLPLTMTPDVLLPPRRGNRALVAVARIAKGITLSQARADVKTIMARVHDEYPVAETGLSFDVMPLRDHIVGDARASLLVLVAAVAFVLLIACANVAILLLLRARKRSAEMGIRLALGASPGRVVREVLAESLVYGAAGGVLGVALAMLAVRAAVVIRPPNVPLIDDVAVDWRVLLFAIAVTMLTPVVFGIAPAIFASKTDLVGALTSGTRSSSAGKKSALLRQAFVVAELALALVLLVGSGLLGKSFQRLMSVDLGFRPEGLVTFELAVPADSDPRTTAFTEALVRDLRAVPGTESAAAGFGAPFTGPAANMTTVHIEGDASEVVDRPSLSEWKCVTPGYIETLGIRLVRGRTFTDEDRAGARRTVIVNEAFAKAYLGGGDPIGKIVTNRGEIIGVVGNVKNQALTEAAEPAMYLAFDQEPVPYISVVIRSRADPAAVLASARKRLATLDKTLPVVGGTTYNELVSGVAIRQRLSWELVTAFAAFSLLLAAAGIYSVVAFSVRERRREFGIRMAIGAQQREIVRLVLVHSMRLASLGVAIGLIGALAGSTALRSMLYGMGATDFATYASGCGVLIVATLVASGLPAWSAGRIDPMLVMRSE